MEQRARSRAHGLQRRGRELQRRRAAAARFLDAARLPGSGNGTGGICSSTGAAAATCVDGRGLARVGINHDPTSGGQPHASSVASIGGQLGQAEGPCGKPAYLCGFFETRVRHETERFSNFTFAAILAGEVPRNATNHKVELSEVMYFGVIFSNCAEGVALKYFNDYDNLL